MKLTVTPAPECPQGTSVEVRLSRRNLVSLLAKVEGRPPGSARTIEKYEEDGNVLSVIAETDEEHYRDRPLGPGRMHPDTEAAIRERPA